MRACVHADGGTNLADFNCRFKSRPFLFHFLDDIFTEFFPFFEEYLVCVGY